jgi:Delta14-sterol reductase
MLSARPTAANVKENTQKIDNLSKRKPVKDCFDYKQPKTVHFEFFGPHFSAINLIMLPVIVVYLYHFCDLAACPNLGKSVYPDFKNFQTEMSVYLSWIAFHLVLYKVLPGETVLGSKTPNGQRLSYNINGLSSLWASLGLLSVLYSLYGLAPFIWVNDHFLSLSLAGITFATTTSILLYIASLRSDKVVVAVGGNSGYPLYDLWMGRELNPRIFGIDLKYLFELRPG